MYSTSESSISNLDNFFNKSFSTILNTIKANENTNQINTIMTNSIGGKKNNMNSINTIMTNIIANKNQIKNIKIDDNNQVIIEPNKNIILVSYRSSKIFKIFIHELINNGSYNNIYSFSTDNKTPCDNKIIIRISNKNSTVDSINSELKGIKIQYELSSKSENIGLVVDYGKIYNNTSEKKYKIQEYYIIEKYGINLDSILRNSSNNYTYKTVIKFMKELLESIHIIHQNNYAHLDLKPENILLKDIFSVDNKKINNFNFVIVDFGGAKKIKDDISREIYGQMASAAFSPPEILDYLFGKKSDIWAYGIICYLLCINSGFRESNCTKIFLGENKDIIEKNIKKEINYSLKKKIKFKITSNELDNLKIFFLKVFNVNSEMRPNTTELLNNTIFL